MNTAEFLISSRNGAKYTTGLCTEAINFREEFCQWRCYAVVRKRFNPPKAFAAFFSL